MSARTIKSILYAPDILIATDCGLIIYLYLPVCVDNVFAKDIYLAGISTISIVFAIYFAGLATIMASPHDDFVAWLEERGSYSELINRLKYTLIVLFFALLFSIFAFSVTSYYYALEVKTQSKWIFSVFSFMTLYSLFSTASAANASISYAKFRAGYVKVKSQLSK